MIGTPKIAQKSTGTHSIAISEQGNAALPATGESLDVTAK